METNAQRKSVCIVVPTYNRAGTYLKQALDSLLAQTYKNFELIISDNASMDNTEEVCRDYTKRDRRIKYVRQETNIGPHNNFNFLMEKAKQSKADYFLLAADDDLWAATFIEKCVKALDAHPTASGAGSAFIEFDDKGRTKSYDPRFYFAGENRLYDRLKQYILFYENDSKHMFAVCAVWRMELLQDERYDQYEGWDLGIVFRMLAKGPVKLVDEVLFYKRGTDTALDIPKKNFLAARIFKSFLRSRLIRIMPSKAVKGQISYHLFYDRMKYVMHIQALSLWSRVKLVLWNVFVMSRLLWRRKI